MAVNYVCMRVVTQCRHLCNNDRYILISSSMMAVLGRNVVLFFY